MAIQVRRGNEADFDASKMLPGEWAVSLDTKYVRMCFAPGVVLRMATYESFETDKAQIKAILAECKTIQSAVQRIQSEVNSKASMVVEYSNSAKESADRAYSEAERAKTYANNAEAIAGVGIATKDKAGLVKADDILIDADGLLRFITTTDQTTMPNSNEGRWLFKGIGGKCEQGSTSGSQLFDKSAITSGMNVSASDGLLYSDANAFSTDYIVVSGLSNIITNMRSDGNGNTWGAFYTANKERLSSFSSSSAGGYVFAVPSEAHYVRIGCLLTLLDTAIVASGNTLPPYEPYTGGIPSPNPSYPQEIKSVKGKNLLDCRGLATQTTNGVTFTPKYDGNGNLEYVEVNGTATALYLYSLGSVDLKRGESYVLNGSSLISLRDSSGNLVYASANATYTPTEDITVYCKLRVGSGDSFTNEKVYPMIRKASIPDSTYVPYGLLRVKTHGKNFANFQNADNKDRNRFTYTTETPEKIIATKNTNNGVFIARFVAEFKANTTYHISLTENVHQMFIYYNDLWGAYYTSFWGSESSITPPKDGTYVIGVFAGTEVASGTTLTVSNFQIEKGKVATEYEPYTESSINLSQPIELNGIGDVKDVIEGGKVKRKFAKVVFNGSENWYKASDGEYYVVLSDYKYYDRKTVNHMSTQLKALSVDGYIDSGKPDNSFMINQNSQMVCKATKFSTVDEWKAHLQANPMTVVYELATETTEELSLADQVALNSLKTFDGITYLEFDAEIEPTFKGEYGTSKVGGYTLEGMLAGRNGELLGKSYADRITALEATVVNNI